jgi:hypothetical protein
LIKNQCLTLARGAGLQTTDDGLARDAIVATGAIATCIAIVAEAILIVPKFTSNSEMRQGAYVAMRY